MRMLPRYVESGIESSHAEVLMLIRRIELQRILSFGLDGMELEMGPLSVLIGPNGSGKSNLIDVIGLLKALPTDLQAALRERGGAGEWVWQGAADPPVAEVSISLREPDRRAAKVEPSGRDLLYSVTLAGAPRAMCVLKERLSTDRNGDTAFFARDLTGVVMGHGANEKEVAVGIDEYGVGISDSILTALKDRRRYPEITHVGESLKDIRLYREWIFGRNAPLRIPQKNDLPNKYLLEDASNLGLVLNRLAKDYAVKQRLVNYLRELYEGALDLHIDVEHGSVQVFVQEGDVSVPATRLSDGTLRYLCLLAILCDPHPPPVVCLEEPELGLHPDILPGLARLLREASERCQLVVTTHSDVIVDALTETPESIVVCEKHDGQTTMKRLRKSDLDQWLDRYRLGELWSSGELGGNRW